MPIYNLRVLFKHLSILIHISMKNSLSVEPLDSWSVLEKMSSQINSPSISLTLGEEELIEGALLLEQSFCDTFFSSLLFMVLG